MSWYDDWDSVKKGWEDTSFYDEAKDKVLGSRSENLPNYGSAKESGGMSPYKADQNARTAENIKQRTRNTIDRNVSTNTSKYLMYGGAALLAFVFLKG